MVESIANLTLDETGPAATVADKQNEGQKSEEVSKVNAEVTPVVSEAEVIKDAGKEEKTGSEAPSTKVNENPPEPKKEDPKEPTKEQPIQDPEEIIKAEPIKEKPIEESTTTQATKESTTETTETTETKQTTTETTTTTTSTEAPKATKEEPPKEPPKDNSHKEIKKEGSHRENGEIKNEPHKEASTRDIKHGEHAENGDKKDKDKAKDQDKDKEKKKQKWTLFGWIKKEVYSNKKEKPSDDSRDKEPGDGSAKDKDKENENDEAKERKVLVVTSIDEFPEDCQKLIKQSGIPREKLEANFKILMNVLHFRTGKIFKTPETVNDPPRPALPKSTRLKRGEELITDAGEFKKLYKDMEELGKGGFGSVFQARSTKDKKKLVAIKRMAHKTKKHKAANFHEAAILSYCNHPNIVKYFTCHEIKEELWVVMELMEGGTFEDAAKAWHFSEANIAYIARELLKGIAYLHANQLAHRDLKSANIMMSVRGEVKIIDLGLCADMSVGFPTHMVGSPFWMPPEMIQCKPHSYAVDIWSFAISLLEIANQRPPMIESAVKAMFTVGTEGVTEMFLEEKKWGNEFKDFLRLCLKVDPEERATATDLLNHSFLKKADSRANMENILRRIFLSNSLLNSGF